MTTVAYRDGILAADTMVTYGATLIPFKYKKISKLPNGSLYGFSGNLEIGEIMKRRLINVGEHDGILEDSADLKGEAFEAIIVQPDGDLMFFENRTWIRLNIPYVAMGSGKEHAFGAMHVGASAKQAVKASIDLDPNTGGRVTWIVAPKWEGERSRVEQCWD